MIIERPYTNNDDNIVNYFIGTEVEKTPAYNLKTLFVVGIHDVDEVLALAEEHKVEHIFLGANQSFSPETETEHLSWDTFVINIVEEFKGYVTLDFDFKNLQSIYGYQSSDCHNFIPLISIKVPFASMLNYNACIKIDDIGFDETNYGVWVHRMDDLTASAYYTPWTIYTNDKIIKGESNE